jgi:hypothetical protein
MLCRRPPAVLHASERFGWSLLPVGYQVRGRIKEGGAAGSE